MKRSYEETLDDLEERYFVPRPPPLTVVEDIRPFITEYLRREGFGEKMCLLVDLKAHEAAIKNVKQTSGPKKLGRFRRDSAEKDATAGTFRSSRTRTNIKGVSSRHRRPEAEGMTTDSSGVGPSRQTSPKAKGMTTESSGVGPSRQARSKSKPAQGPPKGSAGTFRRGRTRPNINGFSSRQTRPKAEGVIAASSGVGPARQTRPKAERMITASSGVGPARQTSPKAEGMITASSGVGPSRQTGSKSKSTQGPLEGSRNTSVKKSNRVPAKAARDRVTGRKMAPPNLREIQGVPTSGVRKRCYSELVHTPGNPSKRSSGQPNKKNRQSPGRDATKM